MKKSSNRKHLSVKILLLTAAIAVLLCGCGASGDAPGSEKKEPVETDAAVMTQPVVTEENMIAELKVALTGAVGEGETIAAVELHDKELLVVIDLTNADPTPLTLADIAWSRAGSVTDAILEFDVYDELWETVTLDFGEVGKVTCSQKDIVSGEYGRYFPATLFDSLIGLD